jgi:hypothetical protein
MEKTAKLIKDIKVYRGAELNTDHFLLNARLQFPSRWKNSKNCDKISRRNNQLPQIKYEIRLLNNDSIKWLYRRRIEEHSKNIMVNATIETECYNVQNIINRVPNGSLGNIEIKHRRKYLKIWDEEKKQ